MNKIQFIKNQVGFSLRTGRGSKEIDILANNFVIVEQIAEFDFFKDLQIKACNMRGQASRTGESPS